MPGSASATSRYSVTSATSRPRSPSASRIGAGTCTGGDTADSRAPGQPQALHERSDDVTRDRVVGDLERPLVGDPQDQPAVQQLDGLLDREQLVDRHLPAAHPAGVAGRAAEQRERVALQGEEVVVQVHLRVRLATDDGPWDLDHDLCVRRVRHEPAEEPWHLVRGVHGEDPRAEGVELLGPFRMTGDLVVGSHTRRYARPALRRPGIPNALRRGRPRPGRAEPPPPSVSPWRHPRSSWRYGVGPCGCPAPTAWSSRRSG